MNEYQTSFTCKCGKQVIMGNDEQKTVCIYCWREHVRTVDGIVENEKSIKQILDEAANLIDSMMRNDSVAIGGGFAVLSLLSRAKEKLDEEDGRKQHD